MFEPFQDKSTLYTHELNMFGVLHLTKYESFCIPGMQLTFSWVHPLVMRHHVVCDDGLAHFAGGGGAESWNCDTENKIP